MRPRSVPIKTFTAHVSGSNSDSRPSTKHGVNVGAIAGGTIGGLAALGTAILFGIYFRRNKRPAHSSYSREALIKSGKREPGIDAVIEPFGDVADRRQYTSFPLHTKNGFGIDHRLPSLTDSSQYLSNWDDSHFEGSQTDTAYITTSESPNAIVTTHDLVSTEPLAREVAQLRREIVQMRIEQQEANGGYDTADLAKGKQQPPSYCVQNV